MLKNFLKKLDYSLHQVRSSLKVNSKLTELRQLSSPHVILLHGPSQNKLPIALSMAWTLNKRKIHIVPDHVKNCCSDRNKIQLISKGFEMLKQESFANLILPEVETALFAKREQDISKTPMVSEFMENLLELKKSNKQSYIFLTSEEPWKIDESILSDFYINEVLYVPSCFPKLEFGHADYKEKLSESSCPEFFKKRLEEGMNEFNKIDKWPSKRHKNKDHEKVEFSVDGLSGFPSFLDNKKCLDKLLNSIDDQDLSYKERWVVSYIRSFCSDLNQSKNEKITQSLEQHLIERPFALDHHSPEGQTVTSLLIDWVKKGHMKQPLQVYKAFYSNSSLSFIASNYWPYRDKNPGFSKKDFEEAMLHPDQSWARWLVAKYMMYLYYNEYKKFKKAQAEMFVWAFGGSEKNEKFKKMAQFFVLEYYGYHVRFISIMLVVVAANFQAAVEEAQYLAEHYVCSGVCLNNFASRKEKVLQKVKQLSLCFSGEGDYSFLSDHLKEIIRHPKGSLRTKAIKDFEKAYDDFFKNKNFEKAS